MLAKVLKLLCGIVFRVEVRGRQHLPSQDQEQQKLLIVANHESFLDGLLLGLFLPLRATFVVHTTVLQSPLFRLILRMVPHLAVDPSNPLAMKKIIRLLEAGENVVIFPEGRITLTGSLFGQSIDDAVYSYQGILDDGTVVSRYQNIDRMNQYGVELIFESHDLFLDGLTIEASGSWMDARTEKNSTAPSSEGVQFPRIPKWRSNGNLRYAFTPKLKASIGWRYGSRPNSDLFGLVRGDAYGYQTEYFFLDTRLSYDLTPKTQISFGIDNANNDQAYVSHPMPQRSYMLELKYRN